MLVDLLHRFTDHVEGQRPPCRKVALTVALPAVAPGVEVTPGMVRWPVVENGDMVVCGTCGGYAGESLNGECATPHRCVPLQRPDGRWICRAGCDGGKG